MLTAVLLMSKFRMLLRRCYEKRHYTPSPDFVVGFPFSAQAHTDNPVYLLRGCGDFVAKHCHRQTEVVSSLRIPDLRLSLLKLGLTQFND